MWLCGLDADDQPTAINIATCQSIVLVSDEIGDFLLVEWSDSEVSQTVQARGATTCDAAMLIPVMDHLKERKP